MKKESLIQTEVLRWLNLQEYCKAFNNHGTANSGKGRPDISAVFNGRYIAIELKTETGTASKVQIKMLSKLRRCGAAIAICHSLEDVKLFIKNLQEEK